jgi:hypothetical protein
MTTGWDQVSSVIDALAPDAGSTSFPFPRLSYSSTFAGVSVSEAPSINGQQMPGQWLLMEATRVFGWEERVGSYLSGATLVPKGDPLLLARYAIRIWTSADAASYRRLLGTTLKKPVIQMSATAGLILTNASTAVLGIDDAQLKDIGVSKVVVWSVSALLNPLATGSGRGPWTAYVEFKEYRKPRPALPIPDQTIPDTGPVTPSAFNMSQQEQSRMRAGTVSRNAATATRLLNK